MNEYWDWLYGTPALLHAFQQPRGVLDPAMLREGEWHRKERPQAPETEPAFKFRRSEAIYNVPFGDYGALQAYAKFKIRPDELTLRNIGLRYRMDW